MQLSASWFAAQNFEGGFRHDVIDNHRYYLAVISIILRVDKRCSIAVRSNTGSSLWMEGRGDGGDF